MKCVAAIDVDLTGSPIGTRSRLAEVLSGQAVLTRTVSRVAAVRGIETVHVICPADQVEACRALVPGGEGDRVAVRSARTSGSPFSGLIRVGRKWSLDGWRGGLGGVCVLDEFTRSHELAVLAQETEADGVLAVPAGGALFDPQLAEEMLAHFAETAEESRMTFAQAPPGLVGAIYRRDLLMEMGRSAYPPGFVLSYKPDAPQMDLAFKSCCFTAPAAVRHVSGRLIVDTRRAWERAAACIEAGCDDDAERICSWLLAHEANSVPDLPHEVELELTTDDPLAGALLRPRGAEVGARGPMAVDVVERLAEAVAEYDDGLVVLGGFGEPLCHPAFDRVLGVLRDAGVYGIAVRTSGIGLDDRTVDLLIEHEVDVLNVTLDAWSEQRYRQVNGGGDLAAVRARLERLGERKQERGCVGPLVVPEMIKSIDTVDEIDAFYDGWVRAVGCANVAGYSHFAGQRADRAVMSMCPPTRRACRRIRQRMMVLADGRVLRCDQDFRGRYAVGRLGDTSLDELWRGEEMSRLRACHAEGRYDEEPLCASCEEWHRP